MFSGASDRYAVSRPRYPAELFTWLVERCVNRSLVWDCGTGNGQAAVDLAEWFGHVHATDVSAHQIAHALRHPRITYAVEPAERSSLDDGSADLITVAQAVHWFDLPPFWDEVRRVARADGLFAAWGYGWPVVSSEMDETLLLPLRALLETYWAPQNRILWDGYQDQDLNFPFLRLESPQFEIRVAWTTERILHYLTTWSAWERSRRDSKTVAATKQLWTNARARFSPTEVCDVRMPLHVVAARVHATG